jgi:miniconductance mechanosensitive channel
MDFIALIETWLSSFTLSTKFSSIAARTILAIAVLAVACIGFFISRRVIRGTVHRLIKLTKFGWDDHLVANRLFMRMTLIVPGLIFHLFLPTIFYGHASGIAFARGVLNIYFIIVVVLVVEALINSLHDIYRSFGISREIPLKGFVQVLKIVLVGTCLILVIAVVINRSPIYLLSGLGAITAVLMLVFKDPILGFAAGVQLISNRMLKNGDWIEMPKYGANGDVLDITLTTVKVRNWDNTITTIPTYALINDSFKNWRGMQESQGRRIKRAIYIDMNSIQFCSSEMLERFSRIHYITEYMRRKNQEIDQHNFELGTQALDAANTRRLTNIGTFRAYATAYLKNHPMINTDMTMMVRQLASTQHGLPLEVYAFCRDKIWTNYEAVQSDIFDHLLAIAGEFDLKVYQFPAGTDILALAGQNQNRDKTVSREKSDLYSSLKGEE